MAKRYISVFYASLFYTALQAVGINYLPTA